MTCEKLSVNVSDYQGSGGQNRVQVSIDGSSVANATFATSYFKTFNFNDQTVAHSWTVTVTAWDDPDGQKGWTFTKSGTSTPCAPKDACPYLGGYQPPGTPCTPPPDDHEKRDVRDAPNCEQLTITIEHQERSRSYTWDGDSWEPKPWSEWATTSTDTVPVEPGACDTEVTPVAPTYTPPNCTDAPTLNYSNGVGYHWVASGPDTARVLDAVADEGYVLVGKTHFGPYDMTSWTVAEKIYGGCVGQLVPIAVQQSTVCNTNASITIPVSALVAFTIQGGSWTNLAAGDYLVTATLTGGAVEFDDVAGWTVNGSTATRTVHVDAPDTCVTPSASVTPQVCIPEQPEELSPQAAALSNVADGSITVGTEPGVSYTVRNAADEVVDPAALDAGVYTVTATALDGYQLVDGNGFVDGTLQLTVEPPAEDCDTEIPVAPTVTVTDECYTEGDTLTFEADTDEWTAEATDSTHVTFTAKAGYYFLGDEGEKLTQLVLEHAPFTDEQCPLVPGDVGATCVGNVPYLAYDLTLPEGFGDAGTRPLTITFENPDGDDYVLSDLPLSGKMLWPGASDTEPLMWPGWDLVNGEYVDVGNDRFGWTRNGITVSFDVNPHYQTTLTYPPATVACANPPRSTPPNPPPAPPENPPTTPPTTPPGVNRPPTNPPSASPPLPNTGGPNGGLIGIGALLLLGGVALVRRTTRSG